MIDIYKALIKEPEEKPEETEKPEWQPPDAEEQQEEEPVEIIEIPDIIIPAQW
jgi:hypothetical protein